jgi:hypothetical protein
MMGDLPPMEPCPYGKRSAHEMVPITADMLACCACGAVRRIPADPMMDSAEVARRIGADTWTATEDTRHRVVV